MKKKSRNDAPEKNGIGNLLQTLTPRQCEVLKELAKGGYYRDIGESLGISSFTVRAHLHSIYKKLQVKSRAQAIVKIDRTHNLIP